MIIWLDADSLPGKVRDIVSRAAEREEVSAVFAANKEIPHIQNDFTSFVVVESGKTADDYIAENIMPYDLAITRDIPLAARLIENEAVVINDRGDRFDRDTIRERLSQRDWNLALKDAGVSGGGKRSYGTGELKKFSDRFDRELQRLLRL